MVAKISHASSETRARAREWARERSLNREKRDGEIGPIMQATCACGVCGTYVCTYASERRNHKTHSNSARQRKLCNLYTRIHPPKSARICTIIATSAPIIAWTTNLFTSANQPKRRRRRRRRCLSGAFCCCWLCAAVCVVIGGCIFAYILEIELADRIYVECAYARAFHTLSHARIPLNQTSARRICVLSVSIDKYKLYA